MSDRELDLWAEPRLVLTMTNWGEYRRVGRVGCWRAFAAAGVLVGLLACGSERGAPQQTAPILAEGGLPASVFERSAPLEVSVEMDEASWDTLRLDGRSMAEIQAEVPADFEYQRFNATVSVAGSVFEDVEIRKKGFIGSLSTIRPSLKLDFGAQVAIDQEGSRRLTLNNSVQDPSRVRQCLAFDLFSQVGLPASRCAYARVRVNGTPLGIYTVVEPIRKRLLERLFSSAEGNLYEGTLADFTPEGVDRLEAKRVEPGQDDRSGLAAVLSALAADNDEVVARLEEEVDLDQFRTFWALETLLGHWDGYSGNANNYYLYRNPSTGKFVFLPWGTDQIFVGRPGFNDLPYEPTGYAHGALARRLYDLPEQRLAFAERLSQLREQVWQPSELLQQVDDLVAVGIEEDPAALADLRQHVQTHGDFLAEQLEQPLPDVPQRPVQERDECAGEPVEISGEFDSSSAFTAPFMRWTATLGGQELNAEQSFVVMRNGAGTALLLSTGAVAGRDVQFGVLIPDSLVRTGEQPFHSFETFGFFSASGREGQMDELGGTVGDGTIRFAQASAEPDQPVRGRFQAVLYPSACVDW